MGTPGDEFQGLNANLQRPCTPRKHGKLATRNRVAPVIDFIGEHADDRQLSMRLLGSSLRKYQYARDEGLDWRPLVKSQLHSLGMKQTATKRLDTKAGISGCCGMPSPSSPTQ